MKNLVNSFSVLAVSLLLCATVWAGPTACPDHFQSGQAPDIINQKIAAKTSELSATQDNYRGTSENLRSCGMNGNHGG